MTDALHFRQFYLGCLAQASYLIGSGGIAAVVDPRRDVEVYLEEAAANGLEIRHVVETHLHADFVSGHRELAAATGATIHVSRRARAGYPHHPLGEGSEIALGRARLRVLETPGHTRDSICLLLFAPDAAEPSGVLTGDTLFIGDVGRPDLAGALAGEAAKDAAGEAAKDAAGEAAKDAAGEAAKDAAGKVAKNAAGKAARDAPSAREQAGELYDSLHGKLLALPDTVTVWPGHGAGSMCGRNLSSETSSTIGEQRRVNYALQPMTRDAFIEMMTVDLPEVPAYFGRDVRVNREGPPLVAERDPLPPLAIDEFERRAQGGAVVLDTRSAAAFGAAHVPGALHIGLDGQFASWAGTLLPAGTPILLVTDGVEEAEEARMRLARVGLDEAAGYLAGGIAAWSASGRPVASTEQITVDELAARLREDRCRVLDVRRPPEWRTAHISAAVGRPLADLGTGLPELPAGKAIAIICAGGYRSSIAASLFERAGRRDVVNVVGGMAAWNAAGLPTVA